MRDDESKTATTGPGQFPTKYKGGDEVEQIVNERIGTAGIHALIELPMFTQQASETVNVIRVQGITHSNSKPANFLE